MNFNSVMLIILQSSLIKIIKLCFYKHNKYKFSNYRHPLTPHLLGAKLSLLGRLPPFPLDEAHSMGYDPLLLRKDAVLPLG